MTRLAFVKMFAVISLCCAACAPAAGNKLDLSRYKVVFEENFSNLSVSPYGPGTHWIAHTPWHGDFGDARFVDPKPHFPFDRDGGTFRIELRKAPDGHWESGLLASLDEAGHGFGLQYGYFEIRAKLPRGPGVWPAFWLDSFVPSSSPDPSIEIDVFEHYGKFPGAFNSTVTSWPKPGHGEHKSQMFINEVRPGTLSDDFHQYGVEVTPRWLVFYFDGIEYWRTPTPADHKHPLMLLVDLGLGGGWPIVETPSPAYMMIDFIRAYVPVDCIPVAEGLPLGALDEALKACK